MNILVTGRGKSASWMIRGAQLGRAIDAIVTPVVPNTSDLCNINLAVIVKRPRLETIELLHRSKVRIVWDIVDSWPQPGGNDWDRSTCLAWLRSEIKMIRPSGIVAATRAMAEDCRDFGIPTLVLPHHVQPNLVPNPIRPELRIVGYDGGPQYLGRWQAFVTQECGRRGYKFEVNKITQNPLSRFSEMDVVVALRHNSGYAARNWKSNVKLANAQGSGTPIICNSEAGYLETESGGERFADTGTEFSKALDYFSDYETRKEASAKLLSAAPTLDKIAERYKQWLVSKFSS